MTILYLDIETRSAVDLKAAGTHVYFESPTTDVWLACWAIDDGPIQTWWPHEPCPAALAAHVAAGGTVSGWNVGGFEAVAWRGLLGPKYGWIVPDPKQYDDTAAMAAAMSLPRDLASASQALGLPVTKDMEGKALMMRMARPRRVDPLTWWDDPEKLQRLAAYCVVDVETERAARARLMPLSADERAMWLLDAKINERGIGIDRELAVAMQRIVAAATEQLNADMVVATNGNVTAASQVSALTDWLRAEGVAVETLRKAALPELIARDDVPAQCRLALQIRQEAAKASTAKLRSALACTGRDGRARGLLLYHGASTGRWSGRLFQPHNLPRGSGVVKRPESAIPFMRTGEVSAVRWSCGAPLAAVSDCLRAVIRAQPGHDLLAADFTAIEGRVTAWLAGEEWKLDAFRANDAGTGPGIYELTGAGIFGLPVASVGKGHMARQVGKVAELALGFGGGVLAFHSMSLNYPDVRMETAFGPLWEASDASRREKAERRFERCLRREEAGTDRMNREAWLASELTKVGWREKHPATAATWAALEDGARAAILAPETVVDVLRVSFLSTRGFLWLRLPGGRCLAYGSPRLRAQVWVRPWVYAEKRFSDEAEIMSRSHAEDLERANIVKIDGNARAAVTALGVNSVTRRWERFALYSGLIMENVVQAIARDCMAAGMLRAEAAGYPIVLTVHDEVVAEPAKGFGSVEEFERLICQDAPPGLPLLASGWRGERYRKD